jgi:nickel transport protein
MAASINASPHPESTMQPATRFLSLLAATLLAAASAQAHGIWFAQRATQIGLMYGIGADDLDMVKRLPLVQSAAAYDAAGKAIGVKLRAAGPIVLADTDGLPAVLSAVLFNGIWAHMPDGEWIKKGRDEAPTATVVEKNFKYTVHINGQLNGPVPVLADQTLQIIPAVAKLPGQMGQALKLKVLFHGQPAAGARVLTDFLNDPDAKPLKTAKDGSVTIHIRNQGLNVVAAIIDGPSDEPARADKMEHLATLSFVLPHAPE